MPNALMLIAPLAVGIMLGYFLRGKRSMLLDRAVSCVILVLIFSLGFSMGANGELLAVLPSIGLVTFVLLVMALLFSIISLKAARRVLGI